MKFKIMALNGAGALGILIFFLTVNSSEIDVWWKIILFVFSIVNFICAVSLKLEGRDK